MNPADVLLFLVACYTTLAAICPTDWQRYGESCYFLITQPMNWYDANDTCFKSHATLAVPNSQTEQTFIWEMFPELLKGTKPTRSLWIGCNDLQEVGNWQHCPLKNESDVYQNWEEGRPGNNAEKNCVVMSRFSAGQWRNLYCTRTKYATCERPLDTTTPVFCLQAGSNGRVESHCLFGHVMQELRAEGVMSCGKACRSEPRCRSFNLLGLGRGEMVCQLNNATLQEAADGDMKANDKCYFFDL